MVVSYYGATSQGRFVSKDATVLCESRSVWNVQVHWCKPGHLVSKSELRRHRVYNTVGVGSASSVAGFFDESFLYQFLQCGSELAIVSMLFARQSPPRLGLEATVPSQVGQRHAQRVVLSVLDAIEEVDISGWSGIF